MTVAKFDRGAYALLGSGRGIRMSVMTTSGRHVSTALCSSFPLVHTARSSISGAAQNVSVRKSRMTYESSAMMTLTESR
jgi:hypothetical protein